MSEEKDTEKPVEKTYYNEEGDEVKFPGDPESIKKQLEENKETTSKLKELQESQEKLTKELKGYKDKDYNFNKLREKAESKDEKLTATEKLMLEQQEKIEALNTKISSSWTEKALAKIAGKDEETRKKVQEAYDSLNITAETEAEVKEKYAKAALLANVTLPNSNLNSVTHDLGGFPPTAPKVGKLTPELKQLGKNLGVTEEDIKKYNL